MQEPWIIRGCIRGLAACGRLFRAPSVDRPRACVAVKGMEAQLIPHLCSRDVAAVEVNFTDHSVPPVPVIKLAEYCQEKRLPLIMGCDANAHHTVWGSSDTNDRGRKVLEFLASTDLEILNTGDEPTFCTIARREVLDITVCSRQLIQEISFRIAKARGKEVKFRNPRKTKWDSYREDWPTVSKASLRGTGQRTNWRPVWTTCRGLWNPDATLEAIALPDGTVVTGEQCLEHLLEVSFPGFHREQGELFAYKEPGSLRRARQADWRMAAKIVMPEKVKWAINTFKPYKSAGPDGVFPALLQEGLEQIVGPLTQTLRASIAMSYTPSAWKLVRVVFIPKVRRTSYTKAKDFRPISLTSFLLKTLEKLVDAYLRETTLWSHSLHKNQHAYRSGYSTETALH
ncbi:uncharacterized protein [Linepithema humile]|uniref:uncharacterized protein n=1 Tax=Linepithema humile TaxID=83485 RepID=UPI00351ED3E8